MEHFSCFHKRVIAVWLAGLVLLLNAMAVAPALHELIHKDANETGHECAATLFAHGQVDSAAGDIPAVLPAIPVEISPHLEFSPFCPVVGNLPPGRAPPLAASPQA